MAPSFSPMIVGAVAPGYGDRDSTPRQDAANMRAEIQERGNERPKDPLLDPTLKPSLLPSTTG